MSTTQPETPVRAWALISVSDKRGLGDLARGLVRAGYGILSTGGSARALREAGLDFPGSSTMPASHTVPHTR